MANSYYLGAEVCCQGTFTDENGTAQDPAAVFVQIQDPSGTTDSYEYTVDAEVIRSATGVYYVNVDCDEVGYWWYRVYATGSGQAAGEEQFLIKESKFD